MAAPAVRAEFGPTLPAALRARFGVPAWVTVGVAAILGAVGVAAVLIALTRPPSPGTKVVHAAPPVFNLLYPPGILHPRAPAPGELMRLEGHAGKLAVAVTVRPLRLPRYDGDVTHGLLPVYADRFAADRRRALPGYELTAEGRARVNNGVGYEMGYRSVHPGRRVYGRDVLLVPDDPTEGRGYVLLSLRQDKPGGPYGPAEQRLVKVAQKAYRSFRFGTARG
jgi:hypothetical protein